MPTAADCALGIRLLARLPAFLRRPLSTAEAHDLLRHRLERREDDFLRLLDVAVWKNPASPYRALLRRAGCEAGDLARSVRADGVETALAALLREGVYLTVEELKGRRPVRRGELVHDVEPRQLENPAVARHLAARSGGSRGGGTPVAIDLAFVRERAVHLRLIFDAAGWRDARVAVWGVPGAAAMIRILEYAAAGYRPEGWFTPLPLDAPGLEPRYLWSARLLAAAGALARRPLPLPVHAPSERPGRVLDWISRTLAEGGAPYLHAVASAGVRLADAARRRGVHLGGVRVSLGSEPVTARRVSAVEEAGARAIPRYASVETGPIAFGCLRPAAPDDLHLLHDLHAVVRSDGPEPAAAAPGTLFLTSLRPTASVVLLNASLGDQALFEERRCGCPLERLGWPLHLRQVRSAEKLTAAGLTFLDDEVLEVLEETLPARFGGSATDYQLVESPTPGGGSALRLRVHPDVGPLDEEEVCRVLLDGLGVRGGAHRVTELAWCEAGALVVERRPPLTTAVGKVLHLHAETAARVPENR